MDKLKIGVIGTGNISQFHLEAYKNNPDVEIFALCDIDQERVKQKAGTYNEKIHFY